MSLTSDIFTSPENVLIYDNNGERRSETLSNIAAELIEKNWTTYIFTAWNKEKYQSKNINGFFIRSHINIETKDSIELIHSCKQQKTAVILDGLFASKIKTTALNRILRDDRILVIVGTCDSNMKKDHRYSVISTYEKENEKENEKIILISSRSKSFTVIQPEEPKPSSWWSFW